MAKRIIPVTVTTPAGTAQANPQSTAINLGSVQVNQIDILIPPGPAGFLGFYIGNGGGQYIPEGTNTFITPNNLYLSFPVDEAPDNGNWTVVSYNTGKYVHTIYLYFHCNNLDLSGGPSFGSVIGL